MTNPGNADETPPPEEQATPSQTGADDATPEATAGGDPAYEHQPPAQAPSPGFAPLDYPGGDPAPYPPPTGGDVGAQYPGAEHAGPQYPGYPGSQYPGSPYPPGQYGQPGFPAPPYGASQYGPPGYPDPNYYGYTARPTTNTLAIWSLVVALVGLPFLLTGILSFVTVVTSIAGIVLGTIAVNQIKTTGENGRGLAIGGIATGAALLVVIALGVILLVVLAGAAASGAI